MFKVSSIRKAWFKLYNRFKTNYIGWIFVGIAAIMISLFYFYLMIQAFFISLQSGSGNNLSFVGLDNYRRVFSDPTFIAAFKNTFIYLIVQVPVMLLLGLVFSVLLNDVTLKFRSFFRIAIFLPCVTSLVAYSVIFKDLFALDGLVNTLLIKFSIVPEAIQWLTDPFWAKITIILAITWRWTGYNMIFYLSGLQNIDRSIYEAAKIDGAKKLEQIRYITIPMLKPTVVILTLMAIGRIFYSDFGLFYQVPMNSGALYKTTQTIDTYVYHGLMELQDVGMSAAAALYQSVVGFILVVTANTIVRKVDNDNALF